MLVLDGGSCPQIHRGKEGKSRLNGMAADLSRKNGMRSHSNHVVQAAAKKLRLKADTSFFRIIRVETGELQLTMVLNRQL